MKNSKICVGLDIGTTKIVALVGKKNEYDKVNVFILTGNFSLIEKYKGNLTTSPGLIICFSKQKHSILFKYFAASFGETLGIACPSIIEPALFLIK